MAPVGGDGAGGADFSNGCTITVRAVLYPLRIPPGYSEVHRLPLEPGGLASSSRLLMQVDLGDSDILRITLRGEPVGCAGAGEPLPTPPDNSTSHFGGAVLVQRASCPKLAAGSGVGYLPGYRASLSATAPSNVSLDFFCSDQPGLYHVLLDLLDQPFFTEGPPSTAVDGKPTGAYDGAPLGGDACPSSWARVDDLMNISTAIPRGWTEGGAANVLRRPRVTAILDMYRSALFGSQPFADGERREACLSYGQLRTYSIASTGAADATVFVSVDAPISAAYVRRNALPDVDSGSYDASLVMASAPRWGCASAACTEPRASFAISASSCTPDEPSLWYISLRMSSEASLLQESAAATAAGGRGGHPVSIVPGIALRLCACSYPHAHAHIPVPSRWNSPPPPPTAHIHPPPTANRRPQPRCPCVNTHDLPARTYGAGKQPAR